MGKFDKSKYLGKNAKEVRKDINNLHKKVDGDHIRVDKSKRYTDHNKTPRSTEMNNAKRGLNAMKEFLGKETGGPDKITQGLEELMQNLRIGESNRVIQRRVEEIIAEVVKAGVYPPDDAVKLLEDSGVTPLDLPRLSEGSLVGAALDSFPSGESPSTSASQEVVVYLRKTYDSCFEQGADWFGREAKDVDGAINASFRAYQVAKELTQHRVHELAFLENTGSFTPSEAQQKAQELDQRRRELEKEIGIDPIEKLTEQAASVLFATKYFRVMTTCKTAREALYESNFVDPLDKLKERDGLRQDLETVIKDGVKRQKDLEAVIADKKYSIQREVEDAEKSRRWMNGLLGKLIDGEITMAGKSLEDCECLARQHKQQFKEFRGKIIYGKSGYEELQSLWKMEDTIINDITTKEAREEVRETWDRINSGPRNYISDSYCRNVYFDEQTKVQEIETIVQRESGCPSTEDLLVNLDYEERATLRSLALGNSSAIDKFRNLVPGYTALARKIAEHFGDQDAIARFTGDQDNLQI